MNKSETIGRIHPVTYFSGYQGSYVDSSKVVGEVTAVDKDQDDKNSAYGELNYEFVNQTSEFITLNIVKVVSPHHYCCLTLLDHICFLYVHILAR